MCFGETKEAQQQLGYDCDHVVADAITALSFEYDPVHRMPDNTRQEHHERVDDTLDQAQGNHVAIGDVANFVCQHRSHLVTREALQEASADCYQRIVAVPAGSKCIGGL